MAMIDYECNYTNHDDLNDKFNADGKVRFNSGIFSNYSLRMKMGCLNSEQGPSKKTCSYTYPNSSKKTSTSAPDPAAAQ